MLNGRIGFPKLKVLLEIDYVCTILIWFRQWFGGLCNDL